LLIYQLVLVSGNTPHSGNYFPVVSLADRWASARRDKLKGVSDDIAEKLRLVQPFNDGPEAQTHWLSILHCANKINKHHVLIPTMIGSTGWRPTYQLNRKALAGEKLEHDQLPSEPRTELKDGDVLARVRAVSARGDLRVSGIRKIVPAAMKVGFDLPIKVPGMLPDFISLVKGVVDEFEEVLRV
jgi:hypothetical protein